MGGVCWDSKLYFWVGGRNFRGIKLGCVGLTWVHRGFTGFNKGFLGCLSNGI